MSINLAEEKNYLADLQDKLLQEAGRLTSGTQSYSEQFRRSMKYLWENRSGMDAMEIFSNEQSVSQIVRSGEHTVKQLHNIECMLDSPYFARIDFRPEDDDEAFHVYIGRFSFRDKRHDYLVYDWRSPIAGMYYDYDIGAAAYAAPAGTIRGDITGKRQYKVKHGELEYALESDINITDEILQKELAATADRKMKQIVATIQKEQNRLIRDEKAGVLVIQGVAGSGKTSIALHRIAYLLYRRRDTMTAGDVVILSPNKVFASYISSVLPELGEQPIIELGMEDIAAEYLPPGLTLETYIEQTETILAGNDRAYAKRAAFKSTLAFLQTLREFLTYADTAFFTPRDYTFNGYTVEKDYIRRRYLALNHLPVRARLSELAAEIADQIKAMDFAEHKAPPKTQVTKQLTAMLRFQDTMELYQEFYTHIGQPELFCRPELIQPLEYADIFPYLYIRLYLENWETGHPAQHLIIDEMQDYTPVHYAILNKLYPGQKTILGDFGQNVHAFPAISEQEFRELYPDMDFVQIFKSYRSTQDIIDFARQLKPNARIDSAPRRGEPPQIRVCEDEPRELTEILSLIEAFESGPHSTLGIVCKTDRQALSLYQELEAHSNVHYLGQNSTKFPGGISVTSVAMAKGLEFDEVIIPHAGEANYHSDYDRSLLYIAATRAMHKLTLTCHGKQSPLF